MHLSATAFGGGVAEILYTLIPLMTDVGARRRVAGHLRARGVLQRDEADAQRAPGRSRGPHRGAVGRRGSRYNEMNSRELSERLGLVHRPRPAAGGDATRSCPRRRDSWVWRCHIDVSTPNPATMERLLPLHRATTRTSLFHMRRATSRGDGRPVNIVPPAIDPLAPKNMALSPEDASYVCKQFGIDVDRPLICQVSRFDPWKDPLGVIDAYRLVKEQVPSVQLALVGSMATDDPEGWDFFNATIAHAERRPRHPHPQQLQQRRRDRGQRVPVALRRADPEVDARGLRPDGQRGDLEGAAVHRRQRRRHPAAGRERRVRATWSTPSRSARSGRSTSSRTPRWARRSGGAARSTCARTSSRRATCATTCASSASCAGTGPA